MIIISGPSTAGKNTLLETLCARSDWEFIVPTTTRSPRRDEENNLHYEFIDVNEFQDRIRDSGFDDWDYTLGNYYGFRVGAFERARPRGITHALARMALRIREHVPDITLVFLAPADPSEHEAKVRKRFDDLAEQTMRLGHWKEEMAHKSLFDYELVVRGGLEALEGDNAKLWKALGMNLR